MSKTQLPALLIRATHSLPDAVDLVREAAKLDDREPHDWARRVLVRAARERIGAPVTPDVRKPAGSGGLTQ